jgi:aminopeptidase-like protein
MSTTRPDLAVAGERMHRLIAELYPIPRSITGDGLRRTLQRVQAELPDLQIHEVPSGTRVFDWTVPDEWNIREAWIKGPDGHVVVDFRNSSLHVLGYSIPVRQTLPLAELRPHLHTLPDRPTWIPYRTSYYKPAWGFCLAHDRLADLPDGDYEVCIDSTLAPGSLTYGELSIPGRRDAEVLLSCHACHPALANDNLSGVALVTELSRVLTGQGPREHSYRVLLLPGTIGAITWLARNEQRLPHIHHGLVIACVGDPGPFHYKRTRRGDADIDRAVATALRHRPEGLVLRNFDPYGYDERQYNSPGIGLSVGRLGRTPHGEYPEYHTSADDLTLVRPDALAGSLDAYLAVLDALEANRRYINLQPKCEPQLGRRGLYGALGGHTDPGALQRAMLWLLNLSDGHHDLLTIAERSGLPSNLLALAARLLRDKKLLRISEDPDPKADPFRPRGSSTPRERDLNAT